MQAMDNSTVAQMLLTPRDPTNHSIETLFDGERAKDSSKLGPSPVQFALDKDLNVLIAKPGVQNWVNYIWSGGDWALPMTRHELHRASMRVGKALNKFLKSYVMAAEEESPTGSITYKHGLATWLYCAVVGLMASVLYAANWGMAPLPDATGAGEGMLMGVCVVAILGVVGLCVCTGGMQREQQHVLLRYPEFIVDGVWLCIMFGWFVARVAKRKCFACKVGRSAAGFLFPCCLLLLQEMSVSMRSGCVWC